MNKVCCMLLGLIPLTGCHMNGYNDLGEPVNRFSQLGRHSVTYIRAFQESSGPGVELFLLSDQGSDEGSCVSVTLTDDSGTVLVEETIGRYVIDGRQITVTELVGYRHGYIATDTPASQGGAELYDPDPSPVALAFQRLPGAGGLILGEKRFKPLAAVIDSVCADPSPERGPRFMKLFLLYTLVNHCRIPGFGGFGMLQYLGKTTRFDGLLFGHVDFTADGFNEITSAFHYINHSDLTGIVLNGTIINQSNRSGTGTMDGVIQFTVTGSQLVWEGSVDYSEIQVNKTLPSGGLYRLNLEGEQYRTDYKVTNPGGIDFTDVVGE